MFSSHNRITKLRLPSVALFLVVTISVSACTSDPTGSGTPIAPSNQSGLNPSLKLQWKPPFLPIKFGIDTSGNVSVQASSEIVTPVGAFSLGAVISKELEPGELRLIFRNRLNNVDDARVIAVGDVPYIVDLVGKVSMSISKTEVLIDVTETRCVQVRRADSAMDSPCADSLISASGTTVTDTQPTPSQRQEVVVETITVPGDEPNGIEFQIQQAGSYVMELESGAYSPWTEDTARTKNGQWRAFAYVYQNSIVTRGKNDWGTDVPIDPDLIVGCHVDMLSKSDTEKCKGLRSGEVELRQGDKLRFVALDEQQAYPRNRGNLRVRIIKVR